MAELKTYDADWLLEQWCRWLSYGNGGGSHVLGNLVGRGLPAPVITDGEALAIDSILADLLRRRRDVGQAVILFYRHGRNYSAVADEMDIHRKRVMGMVGEGVAWVDGRLDDCSAMDRVRRVFSCFRAGGAAVNDDLTRELAEWFKKIAA